MSTGDPNKRTPREEYPLCPRCGGPVAGAMMTSNAVVVGFGPLEPPEMHYHPRAISVYCVSGSCNYDHKLSDLTTPVPPKEAR